MQESWKHFEKKNQITASKLFLSHQIQNKIIFCVWIYCATYLSKRTDIKYTYMYLFVSHTRLQLVFMVTKI